MVKKAYALIELINYRFSVTAINFKLSSKIIALKKVLKITFYTLL